MESIYNVGSHCNHYRQLSEQDLFVQTTPFKILRLNSPFSPLMSVFGVHTKTDPVPSEGTPPDRKWHHKFRTTKLLSLYAKFSNNDVIETFLITWV